MALVDERSGHDGPGWNNMTGPATEQTPVSRSYLPPAPRETAHTTDVWVSLSVAVALGMTAATIALWPAEQHAKNATQSVLPMASAAEHLPASPEQTEAAAVENSPTRFTNPFDASEVFEFPPGTSADAARESVAEMLLQRARERRPQISNMHGHRSAALHTPALFSEHF